MTTQYIKKNRKPCGRLQKGMLLNNDLPWLKFHQMMSTCSCWHQGAVSKSVMRSPKLYSTTSRLDHSSSNNIKLLKCSTVCIFLWLISCIWRIV